MLIDESTGRKRVDGSNRLPFVRFARGRRPEAQLGNHAGDPEGARRDDAGELRRRRLGALRSQGSQDRRALVELGEVLEVEHFEGEVSEKRRLVVTGDAGFLNHEIQVGRRRRAFAEPLPTASRIETTGAFTGSLSWNNWLDSLAAHGAVSQKERLTSRAWPRGSRRHGRNGPPERSRSRRADCCRS